jgi:hypothetical protein
MLRELWRKSCGCWRYLQLANPAKIGKETTNLQSLTKKVTRICAHSGNAVNVSKIFGIKKTRRRGIEKKREKETNEKRKKTKEKSRKTTSYHKEQDWKFAI